MKYFTYFLILAMLLQTSFQSKSSSPSISLELSTKAIEILEDVSTKLCIDCFGRNLMALFNCLGQQQLIHRAMIIRTHCPDSLRFINRYVQQLHGLKYHVKAHFDSF